LINTSLPSVFNNTSFHSHDNTTNIQLTLLTTSFHTQEIIIEKIAKNNKSTINQLMAMGKAFSNFETEQHNYSLQIGRLQHTANPILNTCTSLTSTTLASAPPAPWPVVLKLKLSDKRDAFKNIHPEHPKETKGNEKATKDSACSSYVNVATILPLHQEEL
jgi:hypothetical protein